MKSLEKYSPSKAHKLIRLSVLPIYKLITLKRLRFEIEFQNFITLSFDSSNPPVCTDLFPEHLISELLTYNT